MLIKTKNIKRKIKRSISIVADIAARSQRVNTKKSKVNVDDTIEKKNQVENDITIDLIEKVLSKFMIDQTSIVIEIEGTHQVVNVIQNINNKIKSRSVKFKILVPT